MNSSVAISSPDEQHQFNQGFTLQGVSILVTLIVGVLSIIGYFKKNRQTAEADASARTKTIADKIDANYKSIDERVREMELQAKDFMPGHEIEARIEHLKSNRVTAENGMARQIDKIGDGQAALTVNVGKLEERQDGVARELGELKTLLKELGQSMSAKIDKQSETLNEMARRVA